LPPISLHCLSLAESSQSDLQSDSDFDFGVPIVTNLKKMLVRSKVDANTSSITLAGHLVDLSSTSGKIGRQFLTHVAHHCRTSRRTLAHNKRLQRASIKLSLVHFIDAMFTFEVVVLFILTSQVLYTARESK
jgi:hypothetical protein